MAIPAIPINIPIRITRPSLPINPKEIVRTPSPGMKLESGIGSRIKEEKSRIKKPITLSAKLDVMNKKRDLKNLSTFLIYGEERWASMARTDLLTDKFSNFFGNFGEEYPATICDANSTSGMAMMLGNGGGRGMMMPKAKIIMTRPNPIESIASTKSRTSTRSACDFLITSSIN